MEGQTDRYCRKINNKFARDYLHQVYCEPEGRIFKIDLETESEGQKNEEKGDEKVKMR